MLRQDYSCGKYIYKNKTHMTTRYDLVIVTNSFRAQWNAALLTVTGYSRATRPSCHVTVGRLVVLLTVTGYMCASADSPIPSDTITVI